MQMSMKALKAGDEMATTLSLGVFLYNEKESKGE